MRVSTHRGRDHRGQPLGEVAQHLEGRRSRADDHRGPQHRGGDARARAGSHRPPRATAGARRASVGTSGARPPEVDDPADACLPGRSAERAGGCSGRSARSRDGAQRVDQVVGDVDVVPSPRRSESAVGGVGADDLDVSGPRAVAQALRVTGHDPHPVAGGEQLGDQPAADVAGRSGDEAAPSAGSVVTADSQLVGPRRASAARPGPRSRTGTPGPAPSTRGACAAARRWRRWSGRSRTAAAPSCWVSSHFSGVRERLVHLDHLAVREPHDASGLAAVQHQVAVAPLQPEADPLGDDVGERRDARRSPIRNAQVIALIERSNVVGDDVVGADDQQDQPGGERHHAEPGAGRARCAGGRAGGAPRCRR